MNDCLPRPEGWVNHRCVVYKARMSATTPGVAASDVPELDLDRSVAVVAGFPEFAELSVPAQRVLAAAAALFQRDGAVATSVRDITRACGLTPGAMYKHFASKDDVLYALVRQGHDRMDRRIAEGLAAAGRGPEDRLRAFVRAYATGNLQNPEFARVVRREYVHLSPARYAGIVEQRRAVRETLTTILRSGHRRGRWRLIGGQGGATRQAVMVLDMCSGTSAWFTPGGPTPATALVDAYVEAALRLVGAPPTA